MRFSAGGVQVRRSLGTADRAEAERLALRAYAEALHRAGLGLRGRAKPFRRVAEEFNAQLLREAERGERRRFQADQWRRIVERYFAGFFADRPIYGGLPPLPRTLLRG